MLSKREKLLSVALAVTVSCLAITLLVIVMNVKDPDKAVSQQPSPSPKPAANPPIVNVPPATGLSLKSAYLSAIGVQDPDGDTVKLSLEEAPEGFTLSQNGNIGLLSWKPGREDKGVYEVSLTISDGELNTNYTYHIFVPPLEPLELISNGDASNGLEGWDIIANGGDGWKVEDTNGQQSFVTSYGKCLKRQVIDLRAKGITADMLSSGELEISDSFCRRSDCPAEYYLDVKLMDENKTVIDSFTINQAVTSTVFKTVQKTFSDIDNLAYIDFQHGGKDRKFWKGHYGARMTGASALLRLPRMAITAQPVKIPKIEPHLAMFSDSGDKLVVVNGQKNEILMFTLADWGVKKFKVPPADAWAFSPDGHKLAFSTRDSVSVLNTGTGTVMYTLPKPKGVLKSLCFSPDNTLLAGCSYSAKSLHVWKDKEIQRSITVGSAPKAVSFTPDSQSLISMHLGKVTLHPLHDEGPSLDFTGNHFSINDAILLPESHRLYAATGDMMISEWDTATRSLLRTFIGHEAPVKAIHPLPDQRLLSISEGVGILWDATTGKPLTHYRFPDSKRIVCAPEGKMLAVLYDTHIVLHRFGTFSEVQRPAGEKFR